MDRLDAIRLFVLLVERGSFSAVGREAGIGQPAVSKQIMALERHLGAQLVLRTSRQVVITDLGQRYYEAAKKLVDDADALESSVGQRQLSPRGRVRLSTAPALGRLCITPLLAEFFRRYPEITLELSASERHVDLLGEGIDLAIRHGTLADSSLHAKKLSDTALVLAASPGYLAARGVPSAVSDLDAHNCIVFARDREIRPWRLNVDDNQKPFMPHGSLHTGDAEQVRAAVLHGLGIAQAPYWLLAEEIRSGQVQVLLTHLQPDLLPMNLVYPSLRRLPVRVRVLVDYLVAAFRRPDLAERVGTPRRR